MMHSALSGELPQVEKTRIPLRAGPFVFELLIPAADVETLRAQLGSEITLHTIFYLEVTPAGGNLDPRLIAFLRPQDNQFFNLFTTLKARGPKGALGALSAPVR